MPVNFTTVSDGKYTIRVGQQQERWAARAFDGMSPITDVALGADRETALAAAKDAVSLLREKRSAARSRDGAPSADEYRSAFAAIGSIHPNHLAMLKAHLRAPDQLISATELAEAAGYPNWNAANLQYGLFAQRIAEELDFEPLKRDDGTPIWTATLATSPADGDLSDERLLISLEQDFGSPHFKWHMRPQVREVVGEL